MFETNYQPKFYKCKLKGIVKESYGSKIQFEKIEDNSTLYILVDESVERIKNRIQDALTGKRDKVYLSHGMRNIDLEKTLTGKWQLFDEYDIYEFEML